MSAPRSEARAPRIFVLSEMYYPEETSTGYLLTKTAEGLAQEFPVTVITGPSTSFNERAEAPAHEVRNQVEIHRCQGTNFSKDSLVGRVVNMVTRSATMFLKTVRELEPCDAVLVVTNPPLLPFAANVAATLKRADTVLLIHDVYPEVLVASQLSSASSPIVRISAAATRVLYNRCARIVTLGRDMTALAEGKMKAHLHERIRCIPNWAENEIVRPTPRAENALLNELGLQDKFVVLYAGNLGRTHGIELLAEAARKLAGTNVHFVVLGFGAKKKWLEGVVKDEGLSNVSILAPRPRKDQIIFLNACDAALISFMPGMAGVSVPSRMYSQMAAGKPILAVADDHSELALVVREEKVGWVVKPEDGAGLIAAIKEAAADLKACREMGKRAAKVAQEKYSFARADAGYRTLFRELFAQVSAARAPVARATKGAAQATNYRA